jgi:hypothetical protein
MSGQFVINYQSRGGVVANPDNSAAAVVSNCDCRAISVNPAGWDQLKEALVFTSPASAIQLPPHKQLYNAQKFWVEIVIRPLGGSSSVMNLIQGYILPLRLSLEKKGTAYILRGEVNTKVGWAKLAREDQLIPVNTWTTVGLAYTGHNLLLLKNDKIISRRVLSQPELSPLGTQDFIVGGAVEGMAYFQGEIAGLRISDSPSAELVAEMSKIFKVGMGEIESKYQSLGGSGGSLGAPNAPEKSIGKGRYRSYDGGNIYWSADTGAHAVWRPLLQCYLSQGGPLGTLGFPITDEFDGAKAGSRISRFEGGAIFWSEVTRAHAVQQMIFVRYLDLGGEVGFLGLPRTDQVAVSGGVKIDFEGGAIFWSSQTGAHEIHGPIRDRYAALGSTAGFLNFPLSDVEEILTKDGQDSGGRLSRFQGGTIYWKPNLGAFEVHGAIRDLYEKLGGPFGKMGYPLTNETKVVGSDITYNNFQNGIIVLRSGIGAREITELQLHIGQVYCGDIDDGIDWFKADKTAELITYLTVKVNGNTIVNNQRRPSGHAGTSYDINYNYNISPVNSDTSIYWKVSVDDWDALSGNDFLGRREETYNIKNIWGILGGGPPGVYNDQPAQTKGGDLPSLSTLKFDYSIQPHLPLDPNKHFREQYWWRFRNFGTATLTRDQFAETFRDVEQVTNWWDELMSPADWAIYELIYKNLAAEGNCFGMCLQALYARAGRSTLIEPLYQYQASADTTPESDSETDKGLRLPINHHHGYQIGDSAVSWYISRLISLEAIDPLRVYQRVKTLLAMGDYPVISVYNLKTFTGHAVLPYAVKDGSGGQPHKILVADPNVPWRSIAGDDASFIEISQDNTFKLKNKNTGINPDPEYDIPYQSETTMGGLLPTTFLMELPYHHVSSVPCTPFWEIVKGLIQLLGGVLMLAGDAETSQVSTGEKNYYKIQNGKKYVVANALSNFQRIPFIDSLEHAPELYTQIGRLPSKLVQQIKGAANGSYKHYMRNKLSGVQLSVPVSLNAQDQISIDTVSEANPFYRIQTSQSVKVSNIDYFSAIDLQKGDFRRFTVNLQLATGTEALIGMDADNGSILLKPVGPVKPLNIYLETRLSGQVKKARLVYTPSTTTDVISLRPLDWSMPLGQVVIERLTAVNGTVLERILIPSQPVTP